MNAYPDGVHAPRAPLLIPARGFRFFVLLLAALITSARSGIAQTQLAPQAATSADSSRRRRRSQQQGSQLETVGPQPIPSTGRQAKSDGDRRRRRSQSNLGGDVANSFISLHAPVHKVTPLPTNADSIEDETAAQFSNSNVASLPQDGLNHGGQKAWSSVGMQVAHIWSKTVSNPKSETDSVRSQQATSPYSSSTYLYSSLAYVVIFTTCAFFCYTASQVIRRISRAVTLNSVQAKIRRANEFFSGLHGDDSLCLACVEFIPSSSSGKVTFLCEHSFHICCVKEWNSRHAIDSDHADSSGCLGRCPICGEASTDLPKVLSDGRSSSADCARLFALSCLAEKYPGVITKEDSENLATQPTAVVQSEIQFARQKPHYWLRTIFAKTRVEAVESL